MSRKKEEATGAVDPGRVDPVDAAIAAASAAQDRLRLARINERVARSSGDPEQIDDAVYERLQAEKAFRDATRAEAQARAARAAARRAGQGEL